MPIPHQIITQKKNKIITIEEGIFLKPKQSQLFEQMHNTWLTK
jgi:hypothetical protein